MKRLILAVVLALAFSPALADRIGLYTNATVYLNDAPCKAKGSEGMNIGRIEYKNGKVVGLCWVEEGGAVWIVDDEGVITAEDPRRFKPLTRI